MFVPPIRTQSPGRGHHRPGVSAHRQETDLVWRAQRTVGTARTLGGLGGVLREIAGNGPIGAFALGTHPDRANVKLNAPANQQRLAVGPGCPQRCLRRASCDDLREQFARRPFRRRGRPWTGPVESQDHVEMDETPSLELGDLHEG